MPSLAPVSYDPFASAPAAPQGAPSSAPAPSGGDGGPTLSPVSYNPFAGNSDASAPVPQPANQNNAPAIPAPNSFEALEDKNGLPRGILNAVMQQESGGNPNAISPAGAKGRFQFMPATAKAAGIDPTDPTDNKDAAAAAQMLGQSYKQYGGNLPMTLAAYNWGSGNLAKNGLANAPPETVDYINKVAANLGVSPQAIVKQTNQAQNSWQSFTSELPRGLEQTGIGIMQLFPDQSYSGMKALMTDMGQDTSQFTPDTFKKILAARQTQLRQAGEGTGIPGTLADLVTDPRTIPAGVAAAAGVPAPVVGAALGYTNPVESPDSGPLSPQRILPTAAGAAFGKASEFVAPAIDAATAPINAVARATTGSNLINPVAAWGPQSTSLSAAMKFMAQKNGLGDELAQAAQDVGLDPATANIEDIFKRENIQLNPKSPTESLQNLQDWLEAKKAGITRQAGYFDPIKAHNEIQQSADALHDLASEGYDQAAQAGQTVTQGAGQIPDLVDRYISQLQNYPGRSPVQDRILTELQNWKEANPNITPPTLLDADGLPIKGSSNMTGAQAIKLKQIMNRLYGSALPPDTTEMQLSTAADDFLKRAGGFNPETGQYENEFGQSLQNANNSWSKMKTQFDNNKLLQQFWQPDDAQRMANPNALESGNEDIYQRLGNVVKNIGDEHDFAAFTNGMSPGQANALRAVKVQQLLGDVGLDGKNLEKNMPLLRQLAKNDPETTRTLNTIQRVTSAYKEAAPKASPKMREGMLKQVLGAAFDLKHGNIPGLILRATSLGKGSVSPDAAAIINLAKQVNQ